jgi:hypothetical protein
LRAVGVVIELIKRMTIIIIIIIIIIKRSGDRQNVLTTQQLTSDGILGRRAQRALCAQGRTGLGGVRHDFVVFS